MKKVWLYSLTAETDLIAKTLNDMLPEKLSIINTSESNNSHHYDYNHVLSYHPHNKYGKFPNFVRNHHFSSPPFHYYQLDVFHLYPCIPQSPPTSQFTINSTFSFYTPPSSATCQEKEAPQGNWMNRSPRYVYQGPILLGKMSAMHASLLAVARIVPNTRYSLKNDMLPMRVAHIVVLTTSYAQVLIM